MVLVGEIGQRVCRLFWGKTRTSCQIICNFPKRSESQSTNKSPKTIVTSDGSILPYLLWGHGLLHTPGALLGLCRTPGAQDGHADAAVGPGGWRADAEEAVALMFFFQ